MNIFGRSQEQQSIDTKTIAVVATPTLTRNIQNAYVGLDLRSWMTSSTFTTLCTGGYGSKTISSLGYGYFINVSFRGSLNLPAPTGIATFQFWFHITDGTNTYDYYTEVLNYTTAIDYKSFDCVWLIQRYGVQMNLTWQMTCPNPSDTTNNRTIRIVDNTTNDALVTYTADAPIALEVYYKSASAEPVSFKPSYFNIDVMRDIALTASYT